jgi:hypothetical protein
MRAEIFSFAELPWRGVADVDVMKSIQGRQKLGNPGSVCPAEVYGIMLDGWRLDPGSRVSASSIVERISGYIGKTYSSEAMEGLLWPSEARADGTGGHATVALADGVTDLDEATLVAAFEQLEMQASDIVLGQVLGEGEFGSVMSAVLARSKQRVAVKTLKGEASADSQRKFLTEARILASLKHRSIVGVIGVCFKTTPNLVVVEFMAGGDLCSYVQKHAGTELVAGELLLSALAQIADAMSVLEKKRIVHRDLAARYGCGGDVLYSILLGDWLTGLCVAEMCLCLAADCRV